MKNLLAWLKSRTHTEPVDPESLSSMELWDYVWKHGCVTCDDNPKFELIAGPSGGMSTNCWCPKCGTRYNVTQLSNTQGLIDITTKFERNFEEEAK